MTTTARPNFLHRSQGNEADDIGRYMEVRGFLSEGARKGAQWLESQNTVLEEVDQLVELMAVEKEVMNREISKLRDEHKELQEREVTVGDENAKLKLDNINKQSMLAMQEEQGAKITGALKDVMELTKQQLEEARFQVNELATRLGMAQDSSDNLASMNEELKNKIKKYKCDFSSLSATMEIQKGETQTLTCSLCAMKEQCRKFQVDNKFLKSHGKELEDRIKIGEDMILALRGRANSSKKIEERLRQKCSSLERALDTASVQAKVVVRTPVEEKTRIELELLRECKKKDEALFNYSSQLTAAQMEQKKQRLQRTKTERLLNTERRKIFTLTHSMEALTMERAVEERGFRDRGFEMRELRKKLRRTTGELKLAKRKEIQFNIAKHEVETTMCRIEEELRRSRQEMTDMKGEMDCKEGLWWGEKQSMEQQKLELIKSHRREVDRMRDEMQLKFEMEGRDDHVDIISKEDYRRLKETSAKRCTELAKEVWKLKSDLEELQARRTPHHQKCAKVYIQSH